MEVLRDGNADADTEGDAEEDERQGFGENEEAEPEGFQAEGQEHTELMNSFEIGHEEGVGDPETDHEDKDEVDNLPAVPIELDGLLDTGHEGGPFHGAGVVAVSLPEEGVDGGRGRGTVLVAVQQHRDFGDRADHGEGFVDCREVGGDGHPVDRGNTGLDGAPDGEAGGGE